MWYSGLNSDQKASIIRCVSTDGIYWNTHQVVVPFATHGNADVIMSHYPYVIKDVDTFKMWYVGRDSLDDQRILYCESSDGVFWNNPIVMLYKNLNGNDNGAIGRMCSISNRELEIPNQYLSGAKIKIYNG